MEESRMRRVALMLLVLVCVLVPAGCGSSGDDDDESGVRVDDEDAGSIVQLAESDMLVVELDGNPSTGYNWFVRSIDETVLKQDGDAEFAAERDVPGSPGIVTLRFNAVGEGTTTLDLAYYRDFEPNVPPARTYQIVVEVR
jgi:inhibitor of cysteine peptidase